MGTWCAKTFIVIAVVLTVGNLANAQITRDVGEIAVIEGDNNIIFTPTDSNGNQCPNVSVNIQRLAKMFGDANHDDVFQFLIMFTNFNSLLIDSNPQDCMEEAGAFHQIVSNSIEGIGRGIFDQSTAYGSSGVLESFLHMNNINSWPIDPTVHSIGNNSFLSLLAQEVGHRWGAFVQVDFDPGPFVLPTTNLLGRSNNHWSFYFQTPSVTGSGEASSLEGNFWVDLGGEQFQTVTITDGFSHVDLYLMGLLPASQVGPFWTVISTTLGSTGPLATASPNAFTLVQQKAQKFFTIQNISDVEGERDPDFSTSRKIFRQAFVLLTQQGVNVTQSELDRIETYRVAWERYFAEKTQNRGAVITNLDNVVFVDRTNAGAENGTVDEPYNTIEEGRHNSTPGGTLVITTGNYPENLTLNEPLKLHAVLGTVRIGG